MRAADLSLQELLAVEEGSLSFHGRRLILHPIHAFGQFRRDLCQMLGREQARRLFTRFGYFWGQADAAAMQRIFTWDSPREWLLAMARLQTIEGAGKVDTAALELDEHAGRLSMELVWTDSHEAEEHLDAVGGSQESIYWKMVGYASGYASYCLAKPVVFVADRCRVKGDSVCSATGKDVESWDHRIDSELPFFEADDIVGRVEQLTQELRRKSRELERQRRKLQLLSHPNAPFFVEGRSKSLRLVVDLATRVARFDSSILITGETGVGKEVLARYVHETSLRGSKPFVAINCSAIPESLLESELFGHKSGAFTGAIQDRIGLFEGAEGGTVFLDEVGEISLAMQVKLLRVLQEKKVTRIGENKARDVDVRVIAATNRHLNEEVAKGTFREDLLYRLRVIEIDIPPLRERREDILPLSRFLIVRLSERLGLPGLRLDATCLDYLQAYPWPGNVRELENAIERAAVLSEGKVILPEYLPPHIASRQAAEGSPVDQTAKSLDQVERDHIAAVLRATDGNRTKAAKILGISMATLWRKLKP